MQTSQELINNTEGKEYSITRLNKSNLKDLARLHSEVYSNAVTCNYFSKKYDTAYTGVENVGFIAYNQGSLPVAYYGVIPCFIQFGNERMLAAQSADTMTHPKHRYKGMFMELSKMTFFLCRELGIRLIFGFPNQNFYRAAVNKWGWLTKDTMNYFTIPVNGFPVEVVLKKIGLRKLYNRYNDYVMKKESVAITGVTNSVLTDGFAGVCRDDKYLHYKTYSRTKVIKIGDSKIWISNKHSLLIGDIEGVDEKNFSTVIEKLKKIAKKAGIRQIQFHCSNGTSLHKLFASSYKAMNSFPTIFQDFGSTISLDKIKFTFADIDIF